MSRYHDSKGSGSQQSFLRETAAFIVERWKKRMGYRFVPECNHVQEIKSYIGLSLRSQVNTTSKRGIGHFRVPKNLTFKTRLSAKPLL